MDPIIETITYDDRLTTVRLVERVSGLKATGHALCDDTDDYDQAFGYELAFVRATARMLKKFEKRLSRGIESIG